MHFFSSSKNERTSSVGILCIQSFLLLRKPNNEHWQMYGSREPMCKTSLPLSDLDSFDVWLFQIQIFQNYFSDLLPGYISSSELCKNKTRKTLSLPLKCVLVLIPLFPSKIARCNICITAIKYFFVFSFEVSCGTRLIALKIIKTGPL